MILFNKLSILITCLFIACTSNALVVLELNTEFLWDDVEPHEGRVVGSQSYPAPTKAQYSSELKYFKGVIEKSEADLVGLVEIENCKIAKDLAETLGRPWKPACLKGRDSYTGQDVAILTKLQIVKNTMNDHSRYYGPRMSTGSKKGVRPSKVLSVLLEDSKGESYLVTNAHLVSRRGDNDLKRLYQATAITRAVIDFKLKLKPDHLIVMGDFNTYPNKPAINELKTVGVVNHAGRGVCSYTYKNTCSLIDHVLVSKSMGKGRITSIELDKRYSDHKAVLFTPLHN